ncbi:hypothetical protein BpHYR1_043974 [Brachionus plicatilis]|uniref:Uncharacterized protein n=1 Tax=Brachionus plicatilis TaxID=10195 RepID=A0A3M7Q1G5_BRAPC|nr:hypothetical protein BpHYR1_043974 [Brachionus plicatilis]
MYSSCQNEESNLLCTKKWIYLKIFSKKFQKTFLNLRKTVQKLTHTILNPVKLSQFILKRLVSKRFLNVLK